MLNDLEDIDYPDQTKTVTRELKLHTFHVI